MSGGFVRGVFVLSPPMFSIKVVTIQAYLRFDHQSLSKDRHLVAL